MHHLGVFHAVAEAGSVTLGAERLQISQPAVSKQLRELEQAVGTGLFDRVGRGVRLTEAGELLARYARTLFAVAAEAERAVGDLKAVGRGVLAVAASTTIGMYLLPPALVAFRRRHPGVLVRMGVGNTAWVHREVTEFRFDLGLSEGFVAGSGLDAEAFAVDQLVVIGHPTHPLAGKKRVGPGDLRDEPFVLREPGSGTRAVQEQAITALGVRVAEVMTLGSTETIKRVVGAGAGLAVVSRLAVRSELDDGRLVVLPVTGLNVTRPLHVVRVAERSPSPTVQAFLGVLSECVPRG